MIRKIAYCFFAVLLFVISIELTSFLALSLDESKKSTKEKREELSDKLTWFFKRYSYHPYYSLQENKSYEYNYVGKDSTFEIAIIGGSFSRQAAVALVERLYGDKFGSINKDKISVTNLAIGSFKQPQQLIKVLLNLEKYDLFINIAGYNEIFTSHHSCRPQYWPLVSTYYDPELKTDYHRSNEFYRSQIPLLKKLAEKSSFFELFFPSLIKLMEKKVNENQNKYKLENEKICQNNLYENPDIFNQRVAIWIDNNKKMHQIVKNTGKKIISIIQPLQYIENSKIISKEEIDIFKKISKEKQKRIGAFYKRAVDTFLKQRLDEGIIDATMIFKNDDETFYSDSCCHLNKKGYSVFLDRVVIPQIKENFKHD
jgi:hypothetical protein